MALLYCFAGCTSDAVAAAVNLRVEDLFDDPKGISYDYRHAGNVVRTVYRSPDKRFRQDIPVKDLVTLYVPDGVDVEHARTVYIPEGEKDADTLASVGVVAVASPMGAANWSKADYAPLLSAAELIVLADRDEPGHERAVGLAEHLKGLGAAVVRIAEPKVGKDVTDHIVAGFGVADLVAVAQPDTDFDRAVESETFRQMVVNEARRRAKETELHAVGDRLNPKSLGELLAVDHPFDWLVPSLLERQDRLIVTGGEGSGKSYLLRQLAIAMAAGVDPFDLRKEIEPVRMLVIDAENSERQWSRNAKYVTTLVEKHGSRSPRDSVMVSAGVRLDLNRPSDVNQVHEMIDKHKPDALYIGPLYKLVSKAINNDDDAAPLIVALDGFRERGLMLLMEAHAGHTKGAKGERDLRPRGSSALLGWPEFGFGLAPIEGDDSMFKLEPWRGSRDGNQKIWPKYVRKGIGGELPWMPVWEN